MANHFLVIADTSLDGHTHKAGAVVKSEQVPRYVRERLQAADRRYISMLAPLTDEQAWRLGATTGPPKPRQDNGDAVHPNELRWQGVNPGDAEHIAELEGRVSALEAAVHSIRSTPASP